MKVYVFVLSSAGWVAHGAARASLAQANNVAKSLTRRLGWVCAVGETAPEAVGPSELSPALAGLSPVWRDADLAAQWVAGKRSRVAVVPPAPAVGCLGDGLDV